MCRINRIYRYTIKFSTERLNTLSKLEHYLKNNYSKQNKEAVIRTEKDAQEVSSNSKRSSFSQIFNQRVQRENNGSRIPRNAFGRTRRKREKEHVVIMREITMIVSTSKSGRLFATNRQKRNGKALAKLSKAFSIRMDIWRRIGTWRRAEITSALVMVHLGRNEPYKHRSEGQNVTKSGW